MRPPSSSSGLRSKGEVSPAPGLLVIELDTPTLRKQGHTRAVDDLERAFHKYRMTRHVRFLRHGIDSEPKLERACLVAHLVQFDAVVIVGHGSPTGLVVAPGIAWPWARVAEALRPVEPRAILAISCFGGSSPALTALFKGIPSLQSVSGSPVPLSARQAKAAFTELLMESFGGGGPMPPELSAAMAVLNVLATRGLVFRRTRQGYATTTRGQRLGQDLLARVVWALMQPPRRRPRRAGRLPVKKATVQIEGTRPGRRKRRLVRPRGAPAPRS
jgi:hypothetical protein